MFKPNISMPLAVGFILYIVDSGWAINMTGNSNFLTNFEEYFLGSQLGNGSHCTNSWLWRSGQGMLTYQRAITSTGNDFSPGSRGTALYSISLQASTTPSDIFANG
ncbi:hypothetical protein Tco_1310380 [Tanacetum coccineum]